ncbi:hypothetical protein DL768_005172 [Monosporascus sp. mg162]|nr:hypothetical protein DL768_005172 [Monosporascus sp. mg162]
MLVARKLSKSYKILMHTPDLFHNIIDVPYIRQLPTFLYIQICFVRHSRARECANAQFVYRILPRIVLPEIFGIFCDLAALSTCDTMANVSLDSSIFFTPLVAADRKLTNRHLLARNGDSSDDVVLVSSNNESDYGDLDDDLSDIYFPPSKELCQPARRDNVEPGNVAGAADTSINATSGDDGNTKELLVTDGADPDDRSAPSQQQQTRGLERSPAPPSAPALPQPSSSPGVMQVEEDQPVPIAGAACKAGQASDPEGTTRSKTAEEISCTIPPGVETQHLPSPGCLTAPSPPRPEDSTHRKSTPHRNSPKSGWRNAALRYGVCRFSDTASVDSSNKDEAETVQKSENHDNPRRHLRRRRRDGMYHPPEGNKREQDEEDDDTRRQPRKRRKMSSPSRTALQTGRTRLDGRFSRTAAPSHHDKSEYQHQAGNPPAGTASTVLCSLKFPAIKKGVVQAPMAKYEEWPLGNAVPKRTTVNDLAAFQLQFTWDSCVNHGHEKLPVKRRPCTKRSTATRVTFTPDEDDLLINPKSQGLPWRKIYMRYRNLPTAKPVHRDSADTIL